MIIKKIAEIESELIYEQPSYGKRSFWNFLIDRRRSERYSGALSFIAFMGFMWIFMLFLVVPRIDRFSFLLTGLSFLPIFILVQFVQWRQCYSIINDDFLFGFMLWGRCFFVATRKLNDIKLFYNDKPFAQYLFVFNWGYLKYTLAYDLNNKRENELQMIAKLSPIPIRLD